MQKKKLFAFITISVMTFFIFKNVFAAGMVPCGGAGEPPCEFTDFFIMINNVIRFGVFKIIPSIAVLTLIIGGIFYLFAGAGSPELAARGKSIIRITIIGLMIVYGSWIIIDTLLWLLGYRAGTWWQLPG